MVASADLYGRNRQYIHQLGTAKGKWNVAKYNKKPGSSSSACVSADMDSNQRKALMADVLFSAGYSGASLLYRANLPPGGSNDTRPVDISSLRSIFFSFARASQTPGHAATAVKLIDTHVNGCLQRMEGDQDRDHALWVSTFDIMVARIQHDASDQGGSQTPALLEMAIGPFIKTGTDDLRSTFPRLQDHRALIPFYLHLSYALIRWNDFAYRTRQLVAVEDTLRMLIDRQLEPEGAHPMIDCLRDCLNWCIETLDQKPEIPTLLEDRQGDSLTGVYQIVGTLWRAYVTNTPTPSWPTPTWASSCEISSGMSAAELLITLICTAMARNLAKMSKPLDCAREGFNDLDELDRHALLHHFLHQLRRTSDPRMLAPRLRPANAVTELGKPPIFAAFLNFVTETLGVEGLAPADATPVIPVVVAHGG
ncbi:hypothetical protein B0T18DRAFT_416164 [Schizothecium vesticola]|uniref:Uncharacterized protein n=1 Tax=Schizothecium vesticola TaxID=314040 RepID=A0AA40ER10_9PEZI|nr:hypothetical protein B0T18DRAFT_416164 [Schizothecium vesticola]